MKQTHFNIQKTVEQLLGPDWVKVKNIKAAYSLFTPFQNKKTGQVYYFYIYYASSEFHLSEQTVNSALTKYSSYLSEVQFLLIQRGLHINSYLIKSDQYLVDLNQFVNLKKQCHQVIQKDFIVKTIQFLVKLYKCNKIKLFSQISTKQIGITENGQLILCDYSLYFKKKLDLKTLPENICNCIMPLLQRVYAKQNMNSSNLNQSLQQKISQSYNQNFVRLMKTVILDPINKMDNQGYFEGFSKEIQLQQIQQALTIYKNSDLNDVNTTLNSTFQEQNISSSLYKSNDNIHKTAKSYIINQSLNQPLLSKQSAKRSNKNKIVIAFVLLALLLFAGVFAFVYINYYNTPIVCQVGQFKKQATNQCLACQQGCLRCISDQNLSCFNCVQTMYLVLDDEKDKTGDCMKNCVGKILHSNFCVKTKKQMSDNETKNLSF